MGYTSQDDLITQISTNGKIDTIVYQKTTPAAGLAGSWQHFLGGVGSIPAATFGGSEATFTATDNAWSEGAIPIGDQTAPATKHILSMGVSLVAATGAPWFILPVDLVGYAKLTTTNVTTIGTKAITMTPIGSSAANVDRYANGVGLRLFVASYAAMGANAPTMQVTYTNSAGTTGKVTTAGCVSTASATSGILLNSGNAANKYGPFLPLAAGDVGVKDIESLIWGGTAHASGSVIVGLCKPLCMPVPIPATGLYNMVDFVNTLPSLPTLKNGACVQFLCFATGATTAAGTFYANFDYGWGG
jgi:hypothetical protein